MRAAHNRLRYHRSWLAIGIALILVLVYLSLTPSVPIDLGSGSDKLEHAAAYGIVMGWFMQIYPALRARAFIAVLLLGLGALLEVLQGLGEVRQLDALDFIADGFGIAIVWLLLRPPYSRLLEKLELRLP